MTKDKRRLGLTVNELLYRRLKEFAEYHGKTINATCVDIFWDYFKRESKI